MVKKKENVIGITYPFQDRKEDHSSGEELQEELTYLEQELLKKENLNNYKEVIFICKSLGGIVANRFIKKYINLISSKINIAILGYITHDINPEYFIGIKKLIVIQGEFDKYGNIDFVKKELKKVNDLFNIELLEVKGGDHSYRNENKQPVYEKDAINKLFHTIN